MLILSTTSNQRKEPEVKRKERGELKWSRTSPHPGEYFYDWSWESLATNSNSTLSMSSAETERNSGMASASV